MVRGDLSLVLIRGLSLSRKLEVELASDKFISDVSLNPGQNRPMEQTDIYSGRKGGEKEARTEFEPQLDGVMRVLDEVPTWKEPCR